MVQTVWWARRSSWTTVGRKTSWPSPTDRHDAQTSWPNRPRRCWRRSLGTTFSRWGAGSSNWSTPTSCDPFRCPSASTRPQVGLWWGRAVAGHTRPRAVLRVQAWEAPHTRMVSSMGAQLWGSSSTCRTWSISSSQDVPVPEVQPAATEVDWRSSSTSSRRHATLRGDQNVAPTHGTSSCWSAWSPLWRSWSTGLLWRRCGLNLMEHGHWPSIRGMAGWWSLRLVRRMVRRRQRLLWWLLWRSWRMAWLLVRIWIWWWRSCRTSWWRPRWTTSQRRILLQRQGQVQSFDNGLRMLHVWEQMAQHPQLPSQQPAQR